MQPYILSAPQHLPNPEVHDHGHRTMTALDTALGKAKPMWWKALAVWFLFMVVAIANGTLRQFVINPAIGVAWGHVISTVLLCTIILGITWATIRWMGPADAGQAWAIGAG